MSKKCECGKELDTRLNYCVHCGKEVSKKEIKETSTSKSKKAKSVKYSPLLEIFNS